MNYEVILREKIRQIINEDYRFQYDKNIFFPNNQMKDSCKKAIEAVSKNKLTGKGEAEGTGLKKAYSIVAGKPMNHGQLKRMKAFFDNNQKEYQDEKFKGKNIFNSGIIQKWNLWGGDVGYNWVKQNLNSHKSKNQSSKDNRPKGHKNLMDPTNTRTRTAISYVKNNLRENSDNKN